MLGGTSQFLSPVVDTVRSPSIGMRQVSSSVRYSSESMSNLSLGVAIDVSDVSLGIAIDVSGVSLGVVQMVGQVSLSMVHVMSSYVISVAEMVSSNVDSMTSTAQHLVLMVSGTVPLVSLEVSDVMSESSSVVHSAISSMHGLSLLPLDTMGINSSLNPVLMVFLIFSISVFEDLLQLSDMFLSGS